VGSGGASSGGGTGGGGGVFIGSVNLPTNIQNPDGSYTGTLINISVGKGGDQTASSTFISLQTYFPGHLLTTPAYGEPYATNGLNTGGSPGLGGGYNQNNLILTDVSSNTYPITQIFKGNGTTGQAPGIVGTLGGSPPWEPYTQWPYITYPNIPVQPGVPNGGQIQPSGNGGIVTTDEFNRTIYGQGDRGMVVLQFNYTGFLYTLYPSIQMFNYGFPFFYTVDSSIVVPNIPGDSSGNVPVTFILQGSGGNGDTTNTLFCTVEVDDLILPNLTYFTGGGGGAIKGTVNLPPGTTIYVHIAGAGKELYDGTFISITPPPTGGFNGPPPTGINGQTYVSPWAEGGQNPYGLIFNITGNPGAGGTTYNGTYLQNANTNTSYTVNIVNSQFGNNGYWTCTPPSIGMDNDPPLAIWVPPDNYVGYPYDQIYTVAVPDNLGQAGVGIANSAWPTGYGTNGIALIGFGIDIPWTVDTVPNYKRRQALKRIPCFVPDTRILTPLGYTPVQNLVNGALVTTDKGKHVPVKVHKRTLSYTDHQTAPYLIPKNSLGPFMPAADLRLSPLHAFRLQPDLWHIPKYAALENKQIKQYDVGKPITYYHLECPNYFTDNLMADGCIVESYGRNQVAEESTLYAYDQRRKGFVRTAKQKNVVMYRR
jgi:hypothetical protein